MAPPATAELSSPTAGDAEQSAPGGSPPGDPPRPGAAHRDNAANLRLIERIFAARTNVRGRAGPAFLAPAKKRQPELILLDLNLPDAHGLDLLRRLADNQETARIPVVASPPIPLGPARRATAPGARAVIGKPIDVGRFLRVVDEVLGTGNEG